VNYGHRRDILAEQLLTSAPKAGFPKLASDSLEARVREVAELRWELAGQPEGTDDENWYRAEDIVRRATAA
jgi:hypothetical protein